MLFFGAALTAILSMLFFLNIELMCIHELMIKVINSYFIHIDMEIFVLNKLFTYKVYIALANHQTYNVDFVYNIIHETIKAMLKIK